MFGGTPRRVTEVQPIPTLALGAGYVGLGLALGFLGRGLKRTQAPDFLHDPLGFEFALQAFESAIDRLSFANNDFRHLCSLISG
jgi:hypothetical protein